jgi:hypothetical protein
MLNAIICAKKLLFSFDWLSAILAIPEYCDEWFAAYFLRRHRLFCAHRE